jgi:hypothetical protein
MLRLCVLSVFCARLPGPALLSKRKMITTGGAGAFAPACRLRRKASLRDITATVFFCAGVSKSHSGVFSIED